MEKNGLSEEKIKEVFAAVEHVGFDVAHDWGDKLNLPFYKYFGDEDYYYRRVSVFSFLGMLINHYYQSSFAFGPETNSLILTDDTVQHDISVYLKSFLQNYELINREFPVTSYFIIKFLLLIDTEKSFEERFGESRYLSYFSLVRRDCFKEFNPNEHKYYTEIKEEMGLANNYF